MTEALRGIAPLKPPGPPAVAGPGRSLAAPPRNGSMSDREFLAPALEILETPASPVHVAFLWIICALVVVALVWAYFGRIDIIASAQGKFQPTGRVKVIESVETGRVAAVHVTNGSAVHSGDVLLELDRSAAEADIAAARDELASARAETLRRRTELSAARARAFSPRRRSTGRTTSPQPCASAKAGCLRPTSVSSPPRSPRSTRNGRKRPPNATCSSRRS